MKTQPLLSAIGVICLAVTIALAINHAFLGAFFLCMTTLFFFALAWEDYKTESK